MKEMANAATTPRKQAQVTALLSVAKRVEKTLQDSFYENGKIKSADSIRADKSLDENISKINTTFLNLWNAAYEQHADNKELIGKVNEINDTIGRVQMEIFRFKAEFNGKLDGFADVDTEEKAEAVVSANNSKILGYAKAPLRDSVEEFTLNTFSEFIGTFPKGMPKKETKEDAPAEAEAQQPQAQAQPKEQDKAAGAEAGKSAGKQKQEEKNNAEALAKAKRNAEKYNAVAERAVKVQDLGAAILQYTAIEIIGGALVSIYIGLSSVMELPKFGEIFAGITAGWVTTGFLIRTFGNWRGEHAKRRAAEFEEKSKNRLLEEYAEKIYAAKKRAKEAREKFEENSRKGVIGGAAGLGITVGMGLVAHLYAPVFLSDAIIVGVIVTSAYVLDRLLSSLHYIGRERRELRKIKKLNEASEGLKATVRN